MVHKEIWARLLAYNLLRTARAVAAGESGIEPREASFKGARQVLTAFAPEQLGVGEGRTKAKRRQSEGSGFERVR